MTVIPQIERELVAAAGRRPRGRPVRGPVLAVAAALALVAAVVLLLPWSGGGTSKTGRGADAPPAVTADSGPTASATSTPQLSAEQDARRRLGQTYDDSVRTRPQLLRLHPQFAHDVPERDRIPAAIDERLAAAVPAREFTLGGPAQLVARDADIGLWVASAIEQQGDRRLALCLIWVRGVDRSIGCSPVPEPEDSRLMWSQRRMDPGTGTVLFVIAPERVGHVRVTTRDGTATYRMRRGGAIIRLAHPATLLSWKGAGARTYTQAGGG